ncbi:hypothetical protein [Oceanobacillus neutriphilus]|uniref:Uncharacterized protein n=1 Tax=Oceanobacillus neutriphilus TaxID=531815 RepID=A0ABQ2NTD3_9BACI|nr:hypothetical protein [Oceanobacillus neutriphilus]GGP10129.1 hypothetical protein GCM10011346_17000 [Oceanobacillus neutriphilus]
MRNKAPLTGYSLIFLGAAFIIADADALFNMYYLHYVSIVVGMVILLAYYLTTRSEKNLLCRIGFHKFEHVGWDNEVPFRLIYRCQRCEYVKRVIRSSGGGGM